MERGGHRPAPPFAMPLTKWRLCTRCSSAVPQGHNLPQHPHGQQLHQIDLKFNQRVRLKHTNSLHLELVDMVALIANNAVALITNNAVAFLSGETSDSPTFIASQDFFLKAILIFGFQIDLSLPHTGYSSTACSPAAAPALTRSTTSRKACKPLPGSVLTSQLGFHFMGCAGQLLLELFHFVK